MGVVERQANVKENGTVTTAPQRRPWKPNSDKLWQACTDVAQGELKAFVLALQSRVQRRGEKLVVFDGKLGGTKTSVRCLVDTGASASFMSAELARRLRLQTRELHEFEDNQVSLADGSTMKIRYAVEPSLELATASGTWRGMLDGISPLLLLPGLDGFDIILGAPFLQAFGGQLDFSKNPCRLQLQLPYKAGQAGRVTLTPGPPPSIPTTRLASLRAWRRTFETGNVEQLFLAHIRTQDLWHQDDEELITPPPESPPQDPRTTSFIKMLEEKYGNRVLVDDLPGGLPPSRGQGDLSIKLTAEGQAGPAPFRRPHRMSPAENDEVKRVLADLVEKEFIRPSQSPYGAPVLFARKKDGSLRFCVDYRALNAVTVRDNYPLPRIDELLDRLAGAKYFTSLDLASGYWQIRVAETDVEKTAFQTRYGAYEFLVMPFGLTNAPSAFQRLMNKVFGNSMDDYTLVYLDDVLVFSQTWEEHVKHVCQVLDRLAEHKLKVKRKKSAFGRLQVKFLGHVVSESGIAMDPDKVHAMLSLAAPQNVSDLRSFLGAVNFYRRFIDKCAHKTAPLTDLLRANSAFRWGAKQQNAFDLLKRALSEAPVLSAPDMSKPFFLYTDASQVAVGAALMQEVVNGLAPVGYASKVLSDTERRWPTHERELYGVVFGCQRFRHFLQGGVHAPVVRTDHKPLGHLTTQKELSPKQARWVEYLSQFDVKLEYVEGKQNHVADMLSRLRSLPLKLRCGSTLFVISSVDSPFTGVQRQELLDAYANDSIVEKWSQNLEGEGKGVNEDGLWYYVDGHDKKLYVPGGMRQKVLEEHHDSHISGHLGRDKTVEAVRRYFWWPTLYADVWEYIRTCSHCQRSKSRNSLPPGKLVPLPTPNNPWEVVALDIMGPISPSNNGFDSVVVYTCLLTKMVHIAACKQTDTAMDHARLFFRDVFRIHGLPVAIVSDRDARWTSNFWSVLFSKLGTRLQMSTSFHPQSDGQTERANRTVQQIMRCLLDASALEEDKWDEWLPAVEFAYNNSRHASTGMTPFYLNAGQHPRVPSSSTTSNSDLTKVPAAMEWLKRLERQLDVAKKSLAAAKERQKEGADRRRSDCEFVVGQKVKVSTKLFSKLEKDNLLGKKLSPRYYGPFEVVKVVNKNAVVLDFPPSFRGHKTVNVEKLQPWYESEKFPREVEDEEPVDFQIDGEQAYTVEAFLQRSRRRSPAGRWRWEILVSWKGYGPEDNSWEPESRLKQDLKSNFKGFLGKMKSLASSSAHNSGDESDE